MLVLKDIDWYINIAHYQSRLKPVLSESFMIKVPDSEAEKKAMEYHVNSMRSKYHIPTLTYIDRYTARIL